MYAVIFGVRPLPAHPCYWEMQAAHLKVFLFAKSMDDAGRRACEIVNHLPFQRSRGSLVFDALEGLKLGDAVCQARDDLCVQEAEWSGLALRLVAFPLGADEDWIAPELKPELTPSR